MTLRIQRRFIALVAGAAIVLTGFTAAPARAGNDEAAAAIAALLGLAIVGAVVKDRRDDRKARERRVEPDVVYPRPVPRRIHKTLLPQRCLRNVRTDTGRSVALFGQRCLHRHYDNVQHLPQSCRRQVWTYEGTRRGYGARCLSKHGFHLARS
ncbi:MAG: hypothetical protein AAFQ19_04705 [Pseudomonadota bacterium]